MLLLPTHYNKNRLHAHKDHQTTTAFYINPFIADPIKALHFAILV